MNGPNFFRVIASCIDKHPDGHFLSESNAWRYPTPDYAQVPVIVEFMKSVEADEVRLRWEYKGREYNRLFSRELIDDAPRFVIEGEVKDFIDHANHVKDE